MPCLVFIGIHKMAKKKTPNKQKQTSTVLYSENGKNTSTVLYILYNSEIAMGFFQA